MRDDRGMAALAEPMSGASLADVLERILDKGVVINADIAVSVVGVEVLGIKLRAAIASFETAARYGLEFPTGVDLDAPAWRELAEQRRAAPLAAAHGDRPAMPAANGRTMIRASLPGRLEEEWHDGATTEPRRAGARKAQGR